MCILISNQIIIINNNNMTSVYVNFEFPVIVFIVIWSGTVWA